MQSKVVRMLALALLLCGAGMISAQQPSAPPKQKAAPSKSKLEEMLAEALKNNPDIRVAAAKLAEADAELNRSRLQVMQKVVTLYHSIETQKKTVSRWESETKRLREEAKRAIVDPQVLIETENQLALAKGKLEELEAQLPALLGKSPQTDYELTIQQAKLLRQESIRSSLQTRRAMIEEAEGEKAHKATGAMAEKIRKALQTPVKVTYKDMNLDAILDDLSKKVSGLSFRIVRMDASNKMSFRFEEALPLSAILQALADEAGCVFLVREYGIIAAPGPDYLPARAMTVEEFLRQKSVEK